MPKTSHKTSHITRKGQTYYYRRRLPGSRFGEVWINLKTRNYREAEYLAGMLDAEFGRALPRLRDAAMSAEAEIQAILKANLKRFLDEDLERRMTRKPFSAVYAHWWESGDPQTSDEADLRAIRDAQDSLRRDLAQNSPAEMGDYAAALIKERGLPPDLRNHLAYGLIEAALKGWEIAERRTLGQEPLVMHPFGRLIEVCRNESGLCNFDSAVSVQKQVQRRLTICS